PGQACAPDAGPGELVDISITEPENALPSVTLAELPAPLREACARAGWQSLMPVQSLALPYLLAGRDIMVQSRTGSGKTGCYLLPMLEELDPGLKAPQALVLAPTRELALQVEREAKTLFAGTGLEVCAIYGGVGYKKQMDALRAGVQVIVGTPGRVLDHLLRHTLDLAMLRLLVFDEADRMLSIGFYPDMKEIQRYLPERRHTCLFSATYPPHVLKLAAEFMTSPDLLSLSRKEVHVAEVQHEFCEVKPMDKDRALVRLLETENPASAIIFCNTKANVHYVASVLQGFGYSADGLSADLTQSKREAVLQKVREGKLQYLVATDVAARGIDIPALSHVFLYEPPEDHESYIHRAGRTGRAGSAGTVISLVDVMQRMELERIARHYKINLTEIPAPTDADAAKAASARLMALLEARWRGLTGLERMRVARYADLARELAQGADAPCGADGAAAPAEGEENENLLLLAMLLDACHQESLREGLVFPTETPAPAGGRGSRSGARGRSRGRRETPGETATAANAGAAASPAEGEGAAPRKRRRRSRGRRGGQGGQSPEGAAPAAEGSGGQMA
ncbi:DEAD/DEAH box helicase, partial [Desulfovibrio sp.]|uniref:DEAD/DEAH box helicase n=1 Tax=Desulfovibrio sp. TaxID=885 RepID=UPI0023BFB83F